MSISLYHKYNNKYFTFKINVGEENKIKIERFFNKRQLNKSLFCKTAIIKEIKRVLEEEKQNGITSNKH